MAVAQPEPTVPSIPLQVVPFSESAAEATRPILDWWAHHWMDASHPLARLQQAWLESMIEAVQVESEFLVAWAESSHKLATSLADPKVLHDPAALTGHYQQAARDIHQAHLTRIGRVAEMPRDFKERIWEEIC
ncbi:hypothetical protein [Halomonas sp. BM-2019]|uniref:hypothetical protein n=1 Tax=Halomonas sp. BM-2019 TaxID=2811227 RepID=UPI001B3C1B97|nr:MAG: hypothetical protein J5F18_15330 [Halomonas sp. BM-2019]